VSAVSSPYAAPATKGMMPLVGLMVEPFPEPGREIRAAMEALQFASMNPPETEEALRQLAALPRPWDPATCGGRLREEVWRWLDAVAIWINEQHLWNVSRVGIPECWPAHPHLVHDLAVVAAARYYTGFQVNPVALDGWHRDCLPLFLARIRDRLGDGCQPGEHQPRPRVARDQIHTGHKHRQGRAQRYRDDLERAVEPASMSANGSDPR